MAAVGDTVWVSRHDGTIALISTDTGSVVNTVAVPGGISGPFGGGITGMAVGADEVWLSINREAGRGGRIAAVDRDTLAVIEGLRLDGVLTGIAVVGDAVWVPDRGGDDVVLVIGSANGDGQGLGLRDDGLGVVSFGDAEGEVLRVVEAALGPADGDDLSREMSECTERSVRWGRLRLDFDTREGQREFVGWTLNERGDAVGASGPDLQTEHGIGLGSSGAEVAAVRGAESYSDGTSFEIGTLQVLLDSSAPEGEVDYIGAGFTGCFE